MKLFKEKLKRSFRISWNELIILGEYFISSPISETKQLIKFLIKLPKNIYKLYKYLCTPVLIFYLMAIYLFFLINQPIKNYKNILITFILWIVVLFWALAYSPNVKKWYSKKYDVKETKLLSEK